MQVDPPAAEENRDTRVSAQFRALRPSDDGDLVRRIGIARILDLHEGRTSAIRLGRLVVLDELGRGAMGIVYRARDPRLERLVAVKVLQTDKETSDRSWLVREARALARLSHLNVVSIYDIFTEEAELCISMEYVPGQTLRSWLFEHPDASPNAILSLFVQAGKGLAAAHAAGVVHGDFKPDNVLVGDDGRVRVLDFGLARIGARGRGPEAAVPEGGTPRYMAPEVSQHIRVDARSDQYSFALALEEALDADPLSGESFEDVPDDAVLRSIPAGVKTAIARALQTDAARRFANMDELCSALERAMDAPSDGRDVVLERVERLWLQGLWNESMAGREPIPLRLQRADELVRTPWEGIGTWVEAESPPHTTDDLPDLLERGHGSLLILGPPGGGKTTAMLMLARSLLAAARRDPAAPAPVVLNLASFEPRKMAFADWVVGELVTKYNLPRRRARSWLQDDVLVLLLDGLDEVQSSRRRDCIGAIDAFRRIHPVPTVVASREDEYVGGGIRLEFGVAVRVQPLDDDEVGRFLDSLGADAVVTALREDEELRAQVRTPLMLSLLAVGGINLDARSKQALEDEIFSRYVERALQTRGSGTFSKTEVIQGLAWLARAMQRNGVTDLWLERLQASWLGQPQARFLARALGALSIGLGLSIMQLIPSALVELDWISTLMVLGLSFPATALLVGSLEVRPVESVHWSWRRALHSLPLVGFLGLVVGVVMGLRRGFFNNLAIGTYLGLAGAIALGTEPSDREARVRPNEGIVQSVRSAVRVWLPHGVLGGAVFGLVVVPIITSYAGAPPAAPSALQMGVRFAVGVGSLLFMIYGGAAALLHAALRLVLAARTPLPLRLVTFLDHAASLGLMRKIGGGYIFLHRTLLDYFARQDPSPES